MPQGCATIWISVGRRGRKPLRIGGYYREHTLLRQVENPNKSNEPYLQRARWDQQLVSWKAAAANDANCILLGDLNLDYLEWSQPDSRHKMMVEKTKTDIETAGFTHLVRDMTRCWVGQKDSAVDHIWTNVHNIIVSHSNIVRTDSDHNVIAVIARLKDRILYRQEILK